MIWESDDENDKDNDRKNDKKELTWNMTKVANKEGFTPKDTSSFAVKKHRDIRDRKISPKR